MSYWAETLQKNRLSEMQKNSERFEFLKYVDASFDNITVIPPGTGMIKIHFIWKNSKIWANK